MRRSERAEPVELRVLDGPNVYFTRPAVKLTLDAGAWMRATEPRVARLAGEAGLPAVAAGPEQRGARPGTPGTQQRWRFVARVSAQLTRRLAAATRTNLAVRARPGPEPGEVVVAYPWRRRAAAEAFGREVAALFGSLLASRRPFERLVAEAAASLERVDPGPAPVVPDPSIPVIAVTGTNGKTTTVRLLAHLMRMAGRHVAYSSTDGVYLDGSVVEAGDYSGFAGAGMALHQPGVEVAVLETARGGILLRGIGTLHNDVTVVTNISADHLDLHGIRTLDQLAEVKATITRITRPDGWNVLNADDPRVLAMRRHITGRPWLCSTDPEHPALRSALEEGGRATTVIDGAISFLARGWHPRTIVALEDVPMTLAGISTHNVHNALGAASAALAVGLEPATVARGLATFVLDQDTNPGRANLYEVDGRVVIVDYAHNEAGMAGLVEMSRGLRRPGAEIWLSFGTAGDRTNEIVHGLAFTAARGCDHVVIAELRHYLRGRDRDDLIERLLAGVVDGGASDVPVFPDELQALRWMLEHSAPGDVVAVTALGQRAEIFALMAERGGRRVTPARVRQLVRRARAARSA
jgi:cyanophycin synthetase